MAIGGFLLTSTVHFAILVLCIKESEKNSMRKWIKQLPEMKNCGVIAVAIIAEVSVEAAAEAIGKKGATFTKDLVKGLRKFGFKCPDRCVRVKSNQPLPKLAIGHLSDPKRKNGWHWIVIDGDKIWDGLFGDPDGKPVYWESGWKITSYLPVTK